jgi:hypothetical protein
MIRTNSSTWLAGVASLLIVAGCSGEPNDDTTTDPDTGVTEPDTGPEPTRPDTSETERQDTGPAPSGPGSVTLEFDLPNYDNREYTAVLFDGTGELVAAAWDDNLDPDSDTTRVEMLATDYQRCTTDEVATLPEATYRAYISFANDSGASYVTRPEACPPFAGFITGGASVVGRDIEVAGDRTVRITEDDLQEPATQGLRVENGAISNGTRVGCLWAHPTNDWSDTDFQTVVVGKANGNFQDGAADLENLPKLPTGEYRVICVIDSNEDGEPGTGDASASRVITYDDEPETLDSWTTLE